MGILGLDLLEVKRMVRYVDEHPLVDRHKVWSIKRSIEIIAANPRTKKPVLFGTGPAKDKNIPEEEKHQFTHIYSKYEGRFYYKDPLTDKPYVQIGDSFDKNEPIAYVQTLTGIKEVTYPHHCRISEILRENASLVNVGDELFIAKVQRIKWGKP